MNEDKRFFRRYPAEMDTLLYLDNEPVRAKIIDYSLQGVGAFIYDMPSQIEGAIVHGETDNPVLSCPGKIIREEKTGSGRKVGIKKIGNMKGSIKDYRLSDTLIGLQRSQVTGPFKFISGDITKSIFIRNGEMIFSASSQEQDRFGDMLMQKGRITDTQYNNAVTEMKRTGQRLGQALVRLGYITHEELYHDITYHVERIILSLFGFEDGDFEFIEYRLPGNEVVTLKMSTANLIYHGIKNINNFNILRNELPPMQTILHFSPDPADLFQNIFLDQAGKKVISCIDNKATVKDIIISTKLNRLEALKTICALLNTRVISLAPDVDLAEESIEDFIEEIVVAESGSEIDPALRELMDDMYKRHENLGYYGVLGVQENAFPHEIKRAYYKAAKQFHPDMHFLFADDSLKKKLGTVFAYIHEAYSTLRNPQKRREYDRSIALKPKRNINPKDKAQAIFEKGKDFFNRGEYVKAEMLFGQTISYNNKRPEYHYYHGLTFVKLEDLPRAKASLITAYKLAPYNDEYIAQMGTVYLGLGLKTTAKTLFKKALSMSPDNAVALEGLRNTGDELKGF